MDLEQFKQQELEGPTEMDIPQLGQSADFRIDNVGTLDELYAKVDAIMKKLA